MAAVEGSQERNVVPRWRGLRATASSGELGPGSRERTHTQRELDELARVDADWTKHKTETFAAEFVGTALVLGVPGFAP